MQAIELHDLLLITRADETTLTVSGMSVNNNDNSVLKAHQAVEGAANQKLPASIHLHKRIPPGSGMGGASSDAAATLRGMQVIFRLDLDLERIAEEIGSDVPFFLHGGAARVEGRGGRVTPLPTEPSWFAIAWPEIELSTGDVYQAWDHMQGEAPNHLRRAAEHVEPRIKDFAQRLGSGWQLTGSGSLRAHIAARYLERTGSGSAFFQPAITEEAANRAIANLKCWTNVSGAVAR